MNHDEKEEQSLTKLQYIERSQTQRVSSDMGILDRCSGLNSIREDSQNMARALFGMRVEVPKKQKKKSKKERYFLSVQSVPETGLTGILVRPQRNPFRDSKSIDHQNEDSDDEEQDVDRVSLDVPFKSLGKGEWICADKISPDKQQTMLVNRYDSFIHGGRTILTRLTENHQVEVTAIDYSETLAVNEALREVSQKWLARILSAPSAFLAGDEPMFIFIFPGGWVVISSALNLLQQFFCGYVSFATNEALNRDFSIPTTLKVFEDFNNLLRRIKGWQWVVAKILSIWTKLSSIISGGANAYLSAEDYASNAILALIIAVSGFSTTTVQRAKGSTEMVYKYLDAKMKAAKMEEKEQSKKKLVVELSHTKSEEKQVPDSKTRFQKISQYLFSTLCEVETDCTYPLSKKEKTAIGVQKVLFWLGDIFTLPLYINKGWRFLNWVPSIIGYSDVICSEDDCSDLDPVVFWMLGVFLVINNIFFHRTFNNLPYIYQAVDMRNEIFNLKFQQIAGPKKWWNFLTTNTAIYLKVASVNGLTKSLYKFVAGGTFLTMFGMQADSDDPATVALSYLGAALTIHYFFVVNTSSFCKFTIPDLNQEKGAYRESKRLKRSTSKGSFNSPLSPLTPKNGDINHFGEVDEKGRPNPCSRIWDSCITFICCKKGEAGEPLLGMNRQTALPELKIDSQSRAEDDEKQKLRTEDDENQRKNSCRMS